jgi:hypothetical protein
MKADLKRHEIMSGMLRLLAPCRFLVTQALRAQAAGCWSRGATFDEVLGLALACPKCSCLKLDEKFYDGTLADSPIFRQQILINGEWQPA